MEFIPVSNASRVHVVACGVLAIDIKKVAERLGIEITTDFLEGGLHDRPGELRRRLQASIDRASSAGMYDKIVVGYGVCGRGTVGIHARNIPLTIPKAHDCIALFLGSDAAYRREFSRFPGTYYISAGWFEEKVQPVSSSKSEDGHDKKERNTDLERLVQKYGEDNARAIVDFMSSWQRNYQRAAFIDTGADGGAKYAEYARAMAEEFGWKYEEIPGDLSLLEKMLTTDQTTREVLVVPPHHVTAFDPLEAGLKAVPVWHETPAQGPESLPRPQSVSRAIDGSDSAGLPPSKQACLGLGIDAGGTYTDAVLYDFAREKVLCKSKALTTKWDYTLGIEEALAALDTGRLNKVDLVSVSTTLATNAIVEGHGQTVGLLVMPPYGIFHDSDIPHQPRDVISGRLEIDGIEISPIDPEEVRRIAREMVRRHDVGAFAVSGYGSTINPSHELEVKAILKEETGLSVTCGHELSELLNFRTRADTAVLNARIIPRLEKFLHDVDISLQRRGIDAPVMVVKGDGSLMSTVVARRRPIETILSGPAASVAGAIRLTGRTNALVVDVGGTTSDTAAVEDGLVRTCPDGAHVGRWKTHVRALDMRTIGLGGDSLIAYEKGELTVGPQRVAPAAWLAARNSDAAKALDYLEARIDDYVGSTRPMELVMLTGHGDGFAPRDGEKEVVRALRERPMSVAELAEKSGAQHWALLRLGRLEEHYVIQRCGLTPTDLLHTLGQFDRWDAKSARRLCGMISHVSGFDAGDFIEHVMDRIVRGLAVELLKKQLDEETDPDAVDECPVCQALLGNMLSGGSDEYAVAVTLNRPVIGIGAPVHYFIPQAARLLNAEMIIPPNADVANAIGAITSRVVVSKQVHIRPNELGEYAVVGLPAAHSFALFDEAHTYAVRELERHVQGVARSAGTSESRVEMQIDDKISASAEGMEIFLERVINARLTGPPDIARQAETG